MSQNRRCALARRVRDPYRAPPTMSALKLPIDPKELVPAALGFVLGLGLLAFFVLLAMALDLQLLVNHANIPHQ